MTGRWKAVRAKEVTDPGEPSPTVCGICGQAHLDFVGQDIEAFRLKAAAHGCVEDPPLTFSGSGTLPPIEFTVGSHGRIIRARYVQTSTDKIAGDSAMDDEMTVKAARLLRVSRRAAGFPQEDDAGKSVFQLSCEVIEVSLRQDAWYAYRDWRRRHRLTWRWRTYPGELPPLPAPHFMKRLGRDVERLTAERTG